MWFLPSLFFAYQFIIRITPGLVMPEIMQKFQIDATSYGFFASIYYVGYAGIQIPLALLLDRYDPRKILSLCALLCALGTLALVFTHHWGIALISRFIIGIGSAAGFLGTSKMVLLWFRPELYARMIALNCTIGLMGPVFAGKPMSYLLLLFGFENVFLIMGFVGIIMTFLFALLIKSPLQKPTLTQQNFSHSVFKDLKTLLSNSKIMIVALASLLMVGALEGFADVWGVSYLIATREITKSEAASMVSWIFLGMILGGPILAYLSDKFKSIFAVTSSCGFIMGGIFLSIFYLNTSFNDFQLYSLFFITGILCSYQVLVFSIGVSLVPQSLAAVAVALLNSINMFGGSFFHAIIGYLMDAFWTGNLENNLKVYNSDAYVNSLLVIPFAAILGGLLIMLIGRSKIQNTVQLNPVR